VLWRPSLTRSLASSRKDQHITSYLLALLLLLSIRPELKTNPESVVAKKSEVYCAGPAKRGTFSWAWSHSTMSTRCLTLLEVRTIWSTRFWPSQPVVVGCCLLPAALNSHQSDRGKRGAGASLKLISDRGRHAAADVSLALQSRWQMPSTVPRIWALPISIIKNHPPSREYRRHDDQPLCFHFGWGLSYPTFSIRSAKVSPTSHRFPEGHSTVTVCNQHWLARCDEVVQLYIRDEVSS